MLVYVERTWVKWLGPLVPGLPAFQTLIEQLRPRSGQSLPLVNRDSYIGKREGRGEANSG